MTLIPFPPADLDALALRLLDVAALTRKMATTSRENGVASFELHGNKAHEWLNNLEQWAYEGAARLETQILRERGARRGQAGATTTPKAHSPAPRRAGKKRP